MKKYNITVNGTRYEVLVEEVSANASTSPIYSTPTAPAPVVKVPQASPVAAGATEVIAPMPGTVIDLKVSLGQAVKKGQVICVLEAMKMENDIPAPCDGVIVSVNVQKGSAVVANDVLVSIN